jgi:hypothetical protein
MILLAKFIFAKPHRLILTFWKVIPHWLN